MAAERFCHVTRLGDVPPHLLGGGIAIGNFDGMHRGHQDVIGSLTSWAGAGGRPSLLLTFEPHPRSFFRPGQPLFRLTPPHVKAVLGESLGLAGMLSLDFTHELAELGADEFVENTLVRGLQVRHVSIGYDFCFGARRSGNAEFLKKAGEHFGFSVDVVPPYVDEGGALVSSSRVRDCLAEGRIAEAAGLLGWHWFFEGEVVHGAKRGRTIGFPTANVALPPEARLAQGIYAVIVSIDGVRHNGVASFGRRPTFDNGAPLFETFVFDFSGDLYGKVISVWPISWLRAEMKFDGIESLIAQMNRDADEARAVLAAVHPDTALDQVVMLGKL